MAWLDFLGWRLNRTRNFRRTPVAALTEGDTLEVRLLLTAPAMTDSEQYMLELVNRARANPGAEAARYGIGLNEGLPPGTISAAPKQPLAPQQQLITAAALHSQDMLDRDYFDHVTLGTGTTYVQRIRNQGYTGNLFGENIVVAAKQVSVSQAAYIDELHRDLIRSAEHRDNVMFPGFEEVGIGARFGVYVKNNVTFQSTEMLTQSFGSKNQDPYITGIVYTDADSNQFYTIGESIRNGTVTAVNVSTGVKYSDTIGVSGAYGFVVPAGTYTVTATVLLNGTSKTFGKSANKVVGSDNVKVDFETNSDVLVPAPVAPVVDLNGTAPGLNATTNYTAGGGSVTILETDSTVTDADSSNLLSATITLASPTSTERLSITGAPTAITVASYNATTGVLTLTGNASVADYQTAIRLLKYSDSNTAATGNKSVTVIVNDGTSSSNPATATITRVAAALPGDMDGDGQVTTQDGNLITLILLGASDSTVERLRTSGSTATAAQIRASFESQKSRLDIDNNGATTTQDGNLVVLVKLGASDSILGLLRGPANTPDTRNTAAQIKTAVQALSAGSAALVSGSTSTFSAAVVAAAIVPVTVSVPVVSWPSDLFHSGSSNEAVVVIPPEIAPAAVSERERTDIVLHPEPTSQPIVVKGSCSRSNSEDESDLFFASLQGDNPLLQAL